MIMAPNQTQITFPCRKQSVRRKVDFDEDHSDPSTSPSPSKSPKKDEPQEVPEVCSRRTRASARLEAAASPLKPITRSVAAASPLKTSTRLAVAAASPLKTSLRLAATASPLKISTKQPTVSLPVGLTSPVKSLTSPTTPRKTPKKRTENAENIEESPAVRTSPRKIRVQPPDVSKFTKARQALHTSTPDTIVCRDEELAFIEKFMKEHIDGRKPGSMYISGRPGTGKTACVTYTLNTRQSSKSFKTVFINCMSLQSPASVYVQIVKQLDPKLSPTTKEALAILQDKVTDKGPMIVLVLDEIDQMTTRDQTVLYSLFELPALEGSRFVLIGLANSLDLTDRALIRLQSRVQFKPVLLNFPPYTKQQIAEILSKRLQEAVSMEASTVVAPSALQYLGGKISASSGDLRKAIDVCRRAVELAETNAKKQMVLTPTDANASKAKCVSIPMLCTLINNVESNRFCSSEAGQGDADETPLQQRVIIVSLLVLVKYGKSKQVTLGKLHETYSKVCGKFRVSAIDFEEMVHTCSLIEARGILVVKKQTKKTNIRLAPVTLRLDETEVEQTLKDKTLLSSILCEGPSFV